MQYLDQLKYELFLTAAALIGFVILAVMAWAYVVSRGKGNGGQR